MSGSKSLNSGESRSSGEQALAELQAPMHEKLGWPVIATPHLIRKEPDRLVQEFEAGALIPQKLTGLLFKAARDFDSSHGTDIASELKSIVTHYDTGHSRNKLCAARQMQTAYFLAFILWRLNAAGETPTLCELGGGPSFDVGRPECQPPWAARFLWSLVQSGLLKARQIVVIDPALVPQYEEECFGLTALNVKVELLPRATVQELVDDKHRELIEHLRRRHSSDFIQGIVHDDYLRIAGEAEDQENSVLPSLFPELDLVSLRWFNAAKFDKVRQTPQALLAAYEKFGFLANAPAAADLAAAPDLEASRRIAALRPDITFVQLMPWSWARLAPIAKRIYLFPHLFEDPARYSGQVARPG